MNALIALMLVLLSTGMGPDAAICLCGVLAGAEFLGDCFVGWVWRSCVVGSSERYVRAAIHHITARWRAA
jgi:hypothetical protein